MILRRPIIVAAILMMRMSVHRMAVDGSFAPDI